MGCWNRWRGRWKRRGFEHEGAKIAKVGVPAEVGGDWEY
jgi:hypothetical protein